MRYISLLTSASCVFFGVLSTNGSKLQALNFALAILNFGFFIFPLKSFRDDK